jgi:hypothetical protein
MAMGTHINERERQGGPTLPSIGRRRPSPGDPFLSSVGACDNYRFGSLLYLLQSIAILAAFAAARRNNQRVVPFIHLSPDLFGGNAMPSIGDVSSVNN